ncbi:MAG: PDZ domain-containing protein [Planctomycetota bacterium]|nr:PDZ domain-containing protein [Planctomycetota bacterium]
MKTEVKIPACLLLGLGLLAAVPVSAAEYYVAPAGADANSGTVEKPFLTLPRAQQAAREARAKGQPVTIFLRTGTYYLTEPLVLTPADSGTRESAVIYQAYPHETPVISGGAKLALKWEPYRDGILQAKVPADLATDQLFVNGERQPLARYPNFDSEERIYNGYAADALSLERTKRWADPRGGLIHAMHGSEWGGFHFVITGKKDDGTVTYEGGWQNNRPSKMHGRYRFVENIFEELDSPGEWFLDRQAHTLYFYPPASLGRESQGALREDAPQAIAVGAQLDAATVEVVRLRHLIEFRGIVEAPVRFVTLRGLTLRHAARTFMENKEPLVRSDWTTYRGGAVFYTGSEDCALEDCFLDQVGGNGVFVNNYNRRVTVRGCQIAKAGGNGVAFVGDREAARVPRDWNDRSQMFETLDRTPGPKTDNYPADCLVEDCLIYLSGRVEKQTAPVQIELSQGITVRHCSLYDVPRAGINIGDGCWGGHVVEFCDIFDTVKETGDHGSFNSWGRDRFWGLSGLNLNDDKTWEAEQDLPRLDAVKTVILRNNRWRCDHGWDIDLDDGSTNYHIVNNLCLHGGLKNREGFYRVVENNIIVDNGFHPHVWFKHSQDIFRRNILWTDHYLPAGGMPATPWGREMDYNLVHRAGETPAEPPGRAGEAPAEPRAAHGSAKASLSQATGQRGPARPATKLAEQSQRDAHSIVADALFVDPASGDFRVKDDSPALTLGFVNFPMDQFGVQKPELKAIARTPELPQLTAPTTDRPVFKRPNYLGQAQVRDISGLGDRSAYGLPDETGVLLLNVPAGSPAAKAGLQQEDVIVGCNGKPVKTVRRLQELRDEAAGKPLSLAAIRKQKTLAVELTDYVFVTVEYQPSPEFKTIPLAPAAAVLPAKITAGKPGTMNERVTVLSDGQLAKNYGPVFGNGVVDGLYKLDLGAVKSVAQVHTFSYNQNENRGRQRFVLYGSRAASDPGWNVQDARVFTPLVDLDTRPAAAPDFVATSLRQSGGKPLGAYRWLVWALSPVTSNAGGENTAFQEFQVIEQAP